MGHKQSKRLASIPEITEVFDLNHSDVDLGQFAVQQQQQQQAPAVVKMTNQMESPSTVAVPAEEPETKYPLELKKVIEKVDSLEKTIASMSKSQIELYYATFKDDLHNNWQKVYGVVDTTMQVKNKKIEVIERIKRILRDLNNRVLNINRQRF